MAAKGSDSRQGLIVALVFAVLFVIGLGVATYYGYAGQEDLAKREKDARTAETVAKKNRDWYQFLTAQYKAYLGVASKEDLGDLSVLRGRYESGAVGKGEKNYAENENAIKRLDDKANLGWNLGENRPASTASDKIITLEAEVLALRKKLEASQGEVKAAQDAKRQAEEFAATAAADFKKSLAKLNADYVNLQNQKQKAFLDLQTAFQAENKRVEDAEKKMQAAIEEREKRLTGLELEKKDLELSSARLKREKGEQDKEVNRLRGIQDPVNLLETGTARGKIVRLDRSGNLVWINLGSADNLRPQTRFSVFKDKGDGTPTGELKASLQVTDISGNHLARAQVTYVRDASRNPILPGDLLFNPTWSPSVREHVAIAGIVDLTGQGTDNTAEFMRSLEREGVTVDAYLDLKELVVKGKGLTSQTSYLILGDKVDLGARGVLQDPARVEAVTKLNEKITQMTDEAAKLGIQIIPLRRYLVLTGHRAPRGLNEGPGAAAYTRPLERQEKEAPKKEAAKPGKDEGK